MHAPARRSSTPTSSWSSPATTRHVSYPGTAIHLRSCPGCRADHDGLLEAARRFADRPPE